MVATILVAAASPKRSTKGAAVAIGAGRTGKLCLPQHVSITNPDVVSNRPAAGPAGRPIVVTACDLGQGSFFRSPSKRECALRIRYQIFELFAL